MNDTIDRIEAIIGRKVKRDIVRMVHWAKGNLGEAAASVVGTPDAHVGIVTGFYIKHATPPSPETDGLIGMAHLAAGLSSAGITVTVITDAPCAKAVWAVVDALPEPVDLEVVSVSERSVLALREVLASGDRPLTHLVAIERVSPAADGKPHREHGWDMNLARRRRYICCSTIPDGCGRGAPSASATAETKSAWVRCRMTSSTPKFPMAA